jgi:nucleoside-diphosphate-sugar epimerase
VRRGTVVVTGSEGAIGSELVPSLQRQGFHVERFDVRMHSSCNVRHKNALANAMRDAVGVVHLAAVSRVADAEADKELAYAVNVDGTLNVLEACAAAPKKPWLVFAGSREIFGEGSGPTNYYGMTKNTATAAVRGAVGAGVEGAAILHFSNVYGSARDRQERVVPSFMRAALDGSGAVINGVKVLDFIHISDVVLAIGLAVERLHFMDDRAAALFELEICTGVGTPLSELAMSVSRVSGKPVTVNPGPAAFGEVNFHVGNPAPAAELLGFTAEIFLQDGLRMLWNIVSKDGTRP